MKLPKITYTFVFLFILFFLFGFLIIRHFFQSTPYSENFTTKNMKYKYIPNRTIPNTFKEFTTNELLQESIYAIDFVKTDNQLMSTPPQNPSETMNPEEYKEPVSTLNTYKYYSELETNDTGELDKIFGKYFEPNNYPDKMAKPIELKIFKQKWLDLMKEHSVLFGQINYFCVPSDTTIPSPAKYDPNGFGNYIFDYVSAYSNTAKTQIEKIKKFFYDIMRPIIMHKKLVEYYLGNFQKTNTRDECLFVMNTTKDLIDKINSTTFLSNPKGFVYVFEEEGDKPMTGGILVDTLALFQCMSIVQKTANLFELVKNKAKYPNAIFNMDIVKFYNGYPVYLKKTYPDLYSKKDPLITYLGTHLPTIP